MAKTKKEKAIKAPNVIHGPSKKGQHDWFKETCEKERFKYNTVKSGKGCAWRTLPTAEYKKNFDEIDWGNKEDKE